MILFTLVKILFWLVTVRYSIAAVSYCIYHKTKKTNHREGGNWRMPKEVLLALTEGYKIKVRPQNLPMYTAAEEIKDGTSSGQSTHPPNTNFTLTHLFHKKQIRKRKLFPLLRTGNTALKAFAKNDIVISEILFNTKFTNLTNSKNSAVLNPSPGNSFACR